MQISVKALKKLRCMEVVPSSSLMLCRLKNTEKKIKSSSTIYIRVHTERGKQNSRTFPGLFSFFKDSISSQFCIKQHKKMHFISAVNVEIDIEKRCTHFLCDSGDKNRYYRKK